MANFLDLTFPHPYPYPSLLLHQYSHFAAVDDLLLLPAPSPFLVFESAVDLIRVDPIRSLSDRVAALELGVGRKYKWTAEVEAPERKYKCVAEVKAGKVLPERRFKWTAEFKGKGAGGPVTKTYTFEASAAPAGGVGKAKKGKGEKKEKKEKAMLVEVEDAGPLTLALKQVSSN